MLTATTDISFPLAKKVLLVKRFAGVLVKIGWAFLWQEQFSPLPKWIYSNLLMEWAVSATPAVNRWASELSGMPETDGDVISGHHVYPGSEYCNIHSPHALWHQQSANGFLDFVMMSDYVVGLIEN
jgi:hypothetical protein